MISAQGLPSRLDRALSQNLTPIGKRSRTRRGSHGPGVTSLGHPQITGGISLRSRSGVTGNTGDGQTYACSGKGGGSVGQDGEDPHGRAWGRPPTGNSHSEVDHPDEEMGWPASEEGVGMVCRMALPPPRACARPASEGCVWLRGLQKGPASAQRAPGGLTCHPSRPPPALLPRPRSSNHGGRSHSLAMQGAKVSFN